MPSTASTQALSFDEHVATALALVADRRATPSSHVPARPRHAGSRRLTLVPPVPGGPIKDREAHR
ncbi:hypothetical protein ACIQC7_18915 [Kitasatospora sp. NPDC088556]|uniref:hypothetical protein n=1 Tax=Kitasatospora sp. NPDC088556 TaxID=3364076 RepID=UPI0038253679